MSGRFVRASKYRHVFGRPTRKESCYDGLRISTNAWDSNIVKANPTYLSVNWEASGGGAFAVIPLNEKGRLPEHIPLFRGHTAVVLDTDWSPFNDSLIASGSDDGKVFIWKVPEGFTLYSDAEEPSDVSPVSRLIGHTRKVGHVLFNPAAENVLATSSGDFTVKLWDVESGAAKLKLTHGDIVQSLSWSADGSLLVTTSRDKKLRVWDVRQQKPAQEVQGHNGAKSSRAVWMGEHDRIATTGFSKMSDRQLGLWDVRAPREPMNGFQVLDSISGVCMPFWDDGTQCFDGNIRYFEYENDKFEFLSEYKSGDPQRGLAFLPKRGINTHENEVARAFKTVNDAYIEPISFIVPRRAEVFQNDIYPPTVGGKPGVSSSEWFSGKTALPPKISLESIYDGDAPVEIPAEVKPRAAVETAPVKATPKAAEPVPKAEPKKEEPKAPTVSAVAQRGPPPTMKEQQSSINTMVDKFHDEESDEEDDVDDDSSFEEVPKPTERIMPSSTLAAKPAQKPDPVPAATKTPTSPIATKASPVETSRAVPQPTKPTAATSTDPVNEPIASSLSEIKSLLEAQNRTITLQSDKIGALTAEVDTLKTRMGEARTGREKDERIRQLELELEMRKS
ncbi:MAG: Coronin-like protein crn1 [Vezdaea acicularis]|nr:MAG: Coronin-like protein crn1 [Vezdaea acicularis]